LGKEFETLVKLSPKHDKKSIKTPESQEAKGSVEKYPDAVLSTNPIPPPLKETLSSRGKKRKGSCKKNLYMHSHEGKELIFEKPRQSNEKKSLEKVTELVASTKKK